LRLYSLFTARGNLRERDNWGDPDVDGRIIIFTASNTTGSSHLYNTLELLMMGIMVPETC